MLTKAIARPQAPPRGDGIVYLRTNPETGYNYAGKVKSASRFAKRKREHNRKLDVECEYEIVDRAVPGIALDVAQETAIRQHGGIQIFGGAYENRRHEMNPTRDKLNAIKPIPRPY